MNHWQLCGILFISCSLAVGQDAVPCVESSVGSSCRACVSGEDWGEMEGEDSVGTKLGVEI